MSLRQGCHGLLTVLLLNFILIMLFSMSASRSENSSKNGKKTITITGLIPLTVREGQWNAMGALPAIKMAVQDINESPNILKNYNVNLQWGDTQASSSHALSYFLNTTRWKHKTQILISGGYSEVIASLAMVIPSFNLLQVSFASVSSDLSDSEKYHNFFRTCPDITHLTRPILPVLAHYNWTSVAILHTVSVTFNRGVEILRHDLGKAGIKVLADEEFTYLSNLKRELKSILDSKAHIIIALIHEADAVKAFCQAFHLGLYGREYVWFVTSWITENFWTNSINDASINCTSEQIKEAAQNYLIVDFVEIEYNNITAVSGMTPYQFQQRYIDLAEKKQIEKNQYVGFAYDAIWAIGLCLDNVIRELAAENKSLDDFRYSDSFVGRTILKEMRKVKFQGISILLFGQGFKILNNSDQEPPGVNLFRQLQGVA
ncbi:uncharacterized protein TRIADDRAFT_52580 [Trichoplax adhaerens]|uniref:Gamma-aminobutyric acid type B receptor subunit 2 n=1 Tax=Trichoplax adhaerens TaxID=10228 RepID=B3RJ59_TRIAD|nr:hypothetical protein TRIADDRAFT_52580 [Trichoplax adhaerens]EDV29069.1 hypothetical protein TRIADDRAFT_52580 [Trichoplax adhaerens]|eukprot:XP_002108271.1 hypothetical protein TRIADDRAFT_52580 [Trichoplax adhaerens]